MRRAPGIWRVREVTMRLPDGSSSRSEASDADLMRALAGGDMRAFELIIRRHQGSVHAFAFRTTGRADLADDVTQETFLRVYRSARTYQPTAAFRTWLFRIAIHLCLDRARAKAPGALEDGMIASARRSPEQEAIRQERIAAVQAAVSQLPERQRIALVLHRFERMTHGQIAATTGWSEAAVESLLTRAYDQLRQRLGRWQET